MAAQVLMRFRPIRGRIFAAAFGFEIEIVWLPAALVDEIFRQLQIAPLAGGVIKLHQRQFDFLVRVVASLLAGLRAEHAVDEIGITASNVKKFLFSGGMKIGHRGFQQMPGAIKLVPITQISEAHFRPHHGKMRVEITIRLLRSRNHVDHLIEQCF